MSLKTEPAVIFTNHDSPLIYGLIYLWSYFDQVFIKVIAEA